jgi:hypothetical protein
MPDQPMPPQRDTQFSLRIDPGLLRQAGDKAQGYGGLAAVIRALLRAFVRGDVEPHAADMDHELTAISVRRRKPRKAPSKHARRK